MILSVVFTKLKFLVLFIVNLFRRALCCFRRRRRNSGDLEPLSHIVVNDNPNANDLEQWNDWEFLNKKPVSVQDHIEYYRQQQSKLVRSQSVQSDEEEENEDLFGDMAPKITRQPKVVVGGKSGANKSYTLDAQHDSTFLSNELENWDENTGWDKESADWDAQQVLRSKKRQERERRAWEQQQKRLEKGTRPNVLGAKITS